MLVPKYCFSLSLSLSVSTLKHTQLNARSEAYSPQSRRFSNKYEKYLITTHDTIMKTGEELTLFEH